MRISPAPSEEDQQAAIAATQEAERLARGKRFRQIYMALPNEPVSYDELNAISAGLAAGKTDEVIIQEIVDARAK